MHFIIQKAKTSIKENKSALMIITSLLCLFILFSPRFIHASDFEILDFSHQSLPVNQPVACTTDSNDNLYICDADLRQITVLNSARAFSFSFNQNIDLPIDIAVEGENIFVLDGISHSILKFDLTGNYITKIGMQGVAPSQFYNPTDICFDEDNLYVVDSGNDRIQVFNKSTYALDKIFGLEGLYVELDNPTSIALTDSLIYILEQNSSRIFAIDKLTGDLANIDFSFESQKDADIAILNDNLLLTNPKDKSLDVYNLSLDYISSVSLLSRGYKIFVDSQKNIFICGSTAKTLGSTIKVLNEDFESIGIIPDNTSNSVFNAPYALTKDAGGNFYIADNGNKRIQVFDKNLRHLYNILDHIDNPIDIQYYEGLIYVLDNKEPSLAIFDNQGVYQKEISLGFAVNPISLAVIDSSSFLVSARSDVYLVKITEQGPQFMSLNRAFIDDPKDIVYHNGFVYILNNGNGDVIFINLTSGELLAINFSAASSHPSDASSISVTDNAIYISDNNSSKIYHYSHTGSIIDIVNLSEYSLRYPYSIHSFSDDILYICFKSLNLFGKLAFSKLTESYAITLDGEKVEDFSPDVFSYDYTFSDDTESVKIGAFVSNGIKTKGDIGEFLLAYGLNKYLISFSDGVEWKEYALYITKSMPEGFELSSENIAAFIEYQANSKSDVKKAGNNESNGNSKITFAIDLKNIDSNAFKAISKSKHITTKIKDGKIYITFDQSDFEHIMPEISLAAKEGMMALSQVEIENLFSQKRNMFFILTSLIGIAMMLVVYFFGIYIKSKPKKRNYKKLTR